LKRPAAVAGEVLNIPPPPSMLAAIDKGVAGKQLSSSTVAALVIASPDFQKR
jgi:hypothetical protein